MAYYRRFWKRWRRWRRRRPWRGNFYRRRRGYRRRQKVRKRRKRLHKKVTFWQPPNRVSCKIVGWTLGVTISKDAHKDSVNRVYRTWIDSDGSSSLSFEGGGVNCLLFSLQFLWEEYRMFHNVWSQTNDGHDLARYWGTKIYLQPHRYCDYIFWWDRDWQTYGQENFIKCHPANLLGWKSKIYVRSQTYGFNHRTKRVFIKPPATMTNQWDHMNNWFFKPLFLWGITVVDWFKFFATGQNMPYSPLPNVYVADFKMADGATTWSSKKNCIYNSFYDVGEHNIIRVALGEKNTSPDSTTGPPNSLEWRQVTWADNLPYWMSFYGQNKNYDMGVFSKKEFLEKLHNSGNHTGYTIVWFKIRYPEYLTQELSNVPISPTTEKWISWYIVTSVTLLNYTTGITINQGIALSGPMVMRDNTDFLEIPLLYKSYWQWGGQTFSNQEVLNPGHFGKGAVTVKNPQTVARSVIHPWDSGPSGLLTQQALARIIQPCTEVEERRREPGAERTAAQTDSESWSEEESEESETEQDSELEKTKTIRNLRRHVLRQQYKSRKLQSFLKLLIKPPKGQTWEGAKPPPPQRGPPSPHGFDE
ncbi:MAG: ORF1 [Etatorquevirus sp.]|nr:MAG: ORF1 [Etatorquevirus sp.]